MKSWVIPTDEKTIMSNMTEYPPKRPSTSLIVRSEEKDRRSLRARRRPSPRLRQRAGRPHLHQLLDLKPLGPAIRALGGPPLLQAKRQGVRRLLMACPLHSRLHPHRAVKLQLNLLLRRPVQLRLSRQRLTPHRARLQPALARAPRQAVNRHQVADPLQRAA